MTMNGTVKSVAFPSSQVRMIAVWPAWYWGEAIKAGR